MEGQLPFKGCLEHYKEICSSRLLTKAYDANKLAKLAHGPARLRLYGLKYKYLSKAIELNPYEFCVDSKTPMGNCTLLGIRSSFGFAFHIPAHGLTLQAYLSVCCAQPMDYEEPHDGPTL